MQTSNWPWVYVCELFHIHGNSRSESGVELQLEGGVEFRNGDGAEFQLEKQSRVEFWPRGGVEFGTVEVWDGVSPDTATHTSLPFQPFTNFTEPTKQTLFYWTIGHNVTRTAKHKTPKGVSNSLLNPFIMLWPCHWAYVLPPSVQLMSIKPLYPHPTSCLCLSNSPLSPVLNPASQTSQECKT